MIATGRYSDRPCSREQIRSFGVKRNAVSIIEIRPFRNGRQVFEAAGVQPVFLNQRDAIDYATGRACFRSGAIRVLALDLAITRIIPFSEADRKL